MKVENKSPLAAFLLCLLPGFGHLYIGRVFRFILYAGGFFGPIGILMLVFIVDGGIYNDGPIILAFGCSLFFFAINMLDMMITIARGKHNAFKTSTIMEPDEYDNMRYVSDPLAVKEQGEKTKIMMLSIIPGLGHMYMGLLVRGITIMIMFIGVFAVGLFLTAMLRTPAMLVLWLAMPIIWIYSMFDALSLLSARQKGEHIEDKSLFSNMENYLAHGNKSRVTAILLSLFPGAGHLYLGMQQRGLQLMGAFLISIFIMDELRLSLFFLLLPLLWCYAFFDVMAQIRKWENNELKDEPFISVLIPYQRWIGLGLLVIGIYYLLDRIVNNWIRLQFPEFIVQYNEFKYMLPTIIISFVLILLGIKLLFGTSRKAQARDEEEL